MQATESYVNWDIEGWVKAALRRWANDCDANVQIVPTLNDAILIVVNDEPVARVEVRKIPLRAV